MRFTTLAALRSRPELKEKARLIEWLDDAGRWSAVKVAGEHMRVKPANIESLHTSCA